MRRSYLIAFALTLTALVLSLPGAAAVSQGGVVHVASLSTRPYARFIEPAPAQHGQTTGQELSILDLDPQGAGGDSVGSMPVTQFDRIVVDVSDLLCPSGGTATMALSAGGTTFHVEWTSGGAKFEVTVTPEQGEPYEDARNRFVREYKALSEMFPPDGA